MDVHYECHGGGARIYVNRKVGFRKVWWTRLGEDEERPGEFIGLCKHEGRRPAFYAIVCSETGEVLEVPAKRFRFEVGGAEQWRP